MYKIIRDRTLMDQYGLHDHPYVLKIYDASYINDGTARMHSFRFMPKNSPYGRMVRGKTPLFRRPVVGNSWNHIFGPGLYQNHYDATRETYTRTR